MSRIFRFALRLAPLGVFFAIALASAASGAPVVTCSSYNQQSARLPAESQTEIIPSLTFSCTLYNQLANAGPPRPAGTLYDWEVLLPSNAPLTVSPTLIGGATEPQLTVEVYRHGSSVSEGTATFYAKAPSPGGIYPASGSSGGAVIFPLVNMNPAGDHSTAAAPDTVYVTIDNLRASALQLASNPPSYGGPLLVTVWAKPSQTQNTLNQSNPANIFLPLVDNVPQPDAPDRPGLCRSEPERVHRRQFQHAAFAAAPLPLDQR